MIYDLQRASVLKRISALILDAILISILAAGIAFLLSLATGYDRSNTDFENTIESLNKDYDVDVRVTESEYNSWTEEKQARFNSAREDARYAEAYRIYQILLNKMLIIVTGGLFLSFLILEFFVPLFIFKNGRTVGKKIFGIAVIRNNGVKINGPILFIRSILGKYTIETMIPAYIIILFIFGKADLILVILLFLIPLINLILLFATHNHTPIHDLLATTVEADFESQLIFDTEEDRIEYKKRLHSEDVGNTREST